MKNLSRMPFPATMVYQTKNSVLAVGFHFLNCWSVGSHRYPNFHSSWLLPKLDGMTLFLKIQNNSSICIFRNMEKSN